MGSPAGLERGAGRSLAIKSTLCRSTPKFYLERNIWRVSGSWGECRPLPTIHFLPIQSMFSMQSVTNACFRLPRQPPITQSIVARPPPVLSLPPPTDSFVQKIQSTLPRTLTAGLYWHFHIVDHPIQPAHSLQQPTTAFLINVLVLFGLVGVI